MARKLLVSETTIWRLRKAGKLRPVKLGSRTLRFDVDEVRRVLAENQQEPDPAAVPQQLQDMVQGLNNEQLAMLKGLMEAKERQASEGHEKEHQQSPKTL